MASTINAKNTSTGVVITPDASGQLELQTADTTRMTITSSGNVGIGTSSPTFKVSSTGDIVAGFGNNAGGGGGLISQGSVTTGALGANAAFLDNDGTGLTRIRSYGSNTSTYGAFVFQGATSNNTQAERMRIDANGRVQINDTAPVSGLTAKLTITSATATESNITLKDSGTTYATGTQYISFANSSNASAGSIQHTAVTTVAYATTSDVRLKENIEDAPSSLDKIAQAKVRSFDWKEDKKHVDYGFIAQELYEIYPDAVCKGDDSVEMENPKETWQVDYGRLTPLLLKAIQELKAELDTVKAELATLKGEPS